MPSAATWTDLEAVTLREVRQTQRDKVHDTVCMWNLKKKSTNELIHRAEEESQRQKRNSWLPGGKEPRGKLGGWD